MSHCIKSVLCATLLVSVMACATKPELPPDTESAAAVGSVSFWRWMGRTVMALIQVSEIKVELSNKESQ